ncbi:putative ribonuclease H-like domain-containing protein [Tanacetum coccineum]
MLLLILDIRSKQSELLRSFTNLVRGLPIKHFENDQTYVACLKGKQHKASYKSKIQNSITQPLFMLHMDLFGPTFVSSLMNKKYCLVVTDDYSRFTWVFFLATKDETSGILKSIITEAENLVDKKVKIIRCDNGTEFKNRQNGVAERRYKTLIEAARTMLADSKLPTTFWAEVVNTACYVQNRVLVVKPHNKTPYELFRGRTPALSFMRPFGCHVTILNTLDYLGMFDGKSDEGFFVGYSINSKAFMLRGYSFDEIKTLFETTMRKVNTFVSIESEVDRVVPELAAKSSKRDVEEELDQESSKRQKIGESSELAEEPRDKEQINANW